MRFKSEFAGLNQKIKTAQKKGFRLNEKLKLTKKLIQIYQIKTHVII